MSNALSSVARIAYLSSDLIVDSRPPFPSVSPFAAQYDSLHATSSRRPTVYPVPVAGDPGATLLRHGSAGLASFTAVATAQMIIRLVLHAAELSSLPLVLHLAVTDDLSDVLLLRSAVPFFLVSYTPQQAHDNALLASRLARRENKAVVHVFYNSDDHVAEIDSDSVLPFLNSENLSNGLNGAEHTPGAELYKLYQAAAASTSARVDRTLSSLSSSGPSTASSVVFLLGQAEGSIEVDDVLFASVNLLTPFTASQIIDTVPEKAARVIVLEQVHRSNTKWSPLYLDLVAALQQREGTRPHIQSAYYTKASQVTAESIAKLVQTVAEKPASAPIQLGDAMPSPSCPPQTAPHVPKHELSYTKILAYVFGQRLEISNSPENVSSQGAHATTPEYALGRVRAQVEQRADLIKAVQELLEAKETDADLHKLLSQWLLKRDDGTKSRPLADEIVAALEASTPSHPAAARILSLRQYLPSQSRWIIGSDAWSYDLGASGLHHAIASGLDVNILILDTLPYSARNSGDPHRRKQDVGLYAMNHGDVYVASVAVYSAYAQVLQAVMEADRHKGPSVILAYLPYTTEETPALDILKETKLAVDAGYWPLYRWDPFKESEGREPFALDSDSVKNDLKEFLDRQNHLSQLVRSKPQLAAEIVGNLGDNVKEIRRRKAAAAYDTLLTDLDAPPLTILYASDGGNAEKFAKKLGNQAKARGLATTLATLDSVPLDTLAGEEYVAFVTSTAGQGEAPQNGRQFFKALNAAVARGETPLSKLRYSVFAMGDSHYWPRPEDAGYYNRPGKDLDARLAQLGGERFAELGLGDDQDADGPATGFKVWLPKLWKTFGVDAVEVHEAEPAPITNEHIKAASGYLRGTIAEGLVDTSTGALAEADTQLTKFHGIYQQDDRDIREERLAQGVEPAYSFMIRVRTPAGVCTPEQWLRMDEIADEHGNGTFKLTTRATFQFHGVIKRHLKPSIQEINKVLLDTLAACGDVNRNVTCAVIPTMSKLHKQVFEFSKLVSDHLLPRTTAYHEIWLDKKMVAGGAIKDFEPLYGEFYLPRKFKIAVAVPPTNDVDIYANDVGFIAIVDDKGELAGFNVTIGGGMGVTHGNKKTYPRIADVIGFCTVEQGPLIAEKIMLTQRDNGNRVDRKNARLKYTIDRMGLDVFKAEVEKRLGFTLAPARPFAFDRNIDEYGWHAGEDGRHHCMLYIENGRIQDEPGRDYKTGLREIAKVHTGTFRLTANQHVCISDIEPANLGEIKRLLAKYRLDDLNYTGLRLGSQACVAFPTCGLAMAESERYLPLLVDKVEKMCEENGLRNDSIVMRMTGCPNGCARPYIAEVAFVGKAPGAYLMLLGGGFHGQRLNKIYRENVTEPEILEILGPMIKRYALERNDGEHFGDFVIRAGYIAPTTEGRLWYDRMGGEGEHRIAA
ncbi:sulfite reductase subunit beta [Coniophora puteana RWD-64-598 SS2]|uniref:assimilatory sulfite reductase (NADPH) n=1 Tax=Coniophora puteana (strain RWD-64-598) TaxID=741705 RepID=A0A5M3MKV6_CONPW|nr:sulfite reductase subunit beta [Coniophora puteana RWD-64-598 SS2]EIW79191.1 sulfite reductase subunit beta [Coniophora puteana RWD-64-598 SS2]